MTKFGYFHLINHFYVLTYQTIDGSAEFKEKKEIKAMYL